jgi:hypothetical protein
MSNQLPNHGDPNFAEPEPNAGPADPARANVNPENAPDAQPRDPAAETPPVSRRTPRKRSRSAPALPGQSHEPPTKDIGPVLSGWEYEAGSINVRKVPGLDGREKLQMRLDLGLLQMEVTGRPDGQRPRGCESLLDYFENQLTKHRRQSGTTSGFQLSADDCQQLREEAVMYYHRYLSLFILGDFPGVVRDTARNLRVLDFCGEFATDDHDRFVLEQYRPYIIMMNTRAKASLQFKDEQFNKALHTVTEGLDQIREFFIRFGQEEVFDKSSEVKILKRFARNIRKKLPIDPVERLQHKLQRAIKREDYEEAARLRDLINAKREAHP